MLCCVLCQCKQHYDQKEDERYIIESERQWAESTATDPRQVDGLPRHVPFGAWLGCGPELKGICHEL
jgi:hypothetical protein